MVTILLLGPAGVGKTSFLEKYITGHFVQKYLPTLHFTAYDLEEVTVIDTPGQAYRLDLTSLTDIPIHNIILMYDCNSLLSFRQLDDYVRGVREVWPNVEISLYGNKRDLPSKISSTMIEQFLTTYHITDHQQFSTKIFEREF